MASKQEILHAYRHLYKGLLRGVQYSIPARFIVRDQIRRAFRQSEASSTTATQPATTTAGAADMKTTMSAGWDPEAIKRTIWFLDAAAREKGLEHKILKNMVRTHSERVSVTRHWRRASLWNSKG